ncbi:DNA adenine methylase [Rheinheimera sp. WS51]|uniref:DNA adenine methylase n=1 Tax=Rheinheimera sp. WS51 TaxID=3425886 RepID=UPI003D8CB94A
MNDVAKQVVIDLPTNRKPSFKKADLPLTMQYLGGKARIVDAILESVQGEFGGCSRFVDLFSGSGVVAYTAAKNGYFVDANDIQPYSATLLRSLLRSSPLGIDQLISDLAQADLNDLFGGERQVYFAEYLEEQKFFLSVHSEDFEWQSYKLFCENTCLIGGSEAETRQAKFSSPWTLFLAYYRNTYFGVKQCAEIDFLKQFSFQHNVALRGLVDACVVSVMTDLVSSTTHLAQYLKPRTSVTAKALINKRAKSIIELVVKRLNSLKEHAFERDANVFNLSYEDVFEAADIDSSTIVYADPPYFKEHYSRYYHVLDTYVLYDYPELTFNKLLGKTTVGRYRENRIVSPFGKRSTAKAAFENLLCLCISKRAKLAISYACSSIVSIEFFKDLAIKYGIDLIIDEFHLKHSGQGQSRHKEVIEYLLKYKVT